MKTSELEGAALDWAVAKCEGRDYTRRDTGKWTTDCFTPSSDWAQGGPILEREGITITPEDASLWQAYKHSQRGKRTATYGPTPLIAAMRCYVTSKLGDEVEIPQELK